MQDHRDRPDFDDGGKTAGGHAASVSVNLGGDGDVVGARLRLDSFWGAEYVRLHGVGASVIHGDLGCVSHYSRLP